MACLLNSKSDTKEGVRGDTSEESGQRNCEHLGKWIVAAGTDGMTRKPDPRTVVEVKQEHGRYVCDIMLNHPQIDHKDGPGRTSHDRFREPNPAIIYSLSKSKSLNLCF